LKHHSIVVMMISIKTTIGNMQVGDLNKRKLRYGKLVQNKNAPHKQKRCNKILKPH